MTTIELIYIRQIQGGIGYAPRLYRIGKKYYTVRGDTDPVNFRKLADMDFAGRNNAAMWTKHQFDNVVTAGEFLQIIEQVQS